MNDYRIAILTFAFYISTNGFELVFSPKTYPIHNQRKVKQYFQDLSWLGFQYEHQHQLGGFVFLAAGSSQSCLIYQKQLLQMESFFSRDGPPTLRTAQLKGSSGRGRGGSYHAT